MRPAMTGNHHPTMGGKHNPTIDRRLTAKAACFAEGFIKTVSGLPADLLE
jgi:hypothetical protein